MFDLEIAQSMLCMNKYLLRCEGSWSDAQCCSNSMTTSGLGTDDEIGDWFRSEFENAQNFFLFRANDLCCGEIFGHMISIYLEI